MDRPQKDFQDELLRQKKKKFLEIVRKSTESLRVNMPEVIFWETYCPGDTGHEWAHIHLDSGQICVSEMRLKQMSMEKIEETASHEVTHMIDPTHEWHFHDAHGKLKHSIWRSPGGIPVIDGNAPLPVRNKEKKSKVNKSQCNYNLCKSITKLEFCPHCENYFCTEHIDPYEPAISDKVAEINRFGMHKDGHPCLNFFHNMQEKRTMQDDNWRNCLDNLCGKKSDDNSAIIPDKSEDEIESGLPIETENASTNKPKKGVKQKYNFFKKVKRFLFH